MEVCRITRGVSNYLFDQCYRQRFIIFHLTHDLTHTDHIGERSRMIALLQRANRLSHGSPIITCSTALLMSHADDTILILYRYASTTYNISYLYM